jgi:tetraprenyl-beta-curcumene synthase
VSQPTTPTAIAFAGATCRYWFGAFPAAQSEMQRLRQRAREIPDPVLRNLALGAQRHKWSCLEGAAAFATFLTRRQRAGFAHLLVNLQALLDYADTLMEQPSEDPAANARQLHQAFLVALQPDLPHRDYYRHHPHRQDGGYLAHLADACRTLIRRLPSYVVVADVVIRHAERMVFYQSTVNLATVADHRGLEQWASQQASGATLRWWEIGAACGSSLAVFAHIAAAADPGLRPEDVDAIEALYWPWAEALHILLDSLIDRAEDRETQQPNLLDHYSSQAEMTERLGLLASETAKRADELAPRHRLILAGMVALYLSDEQAWIASARPASEVILAATGTLAKPALLLLRSRRLVLKPRELGLQRRFVTRG